MKNKWLYLRFQIIHCLWLENVAVEHTERHLCFAEPFGDLVVELPLPSSLPLLRCSWNESSWKCKIAVKSFVLMDFHCSSFVVCTLQHNKANTILHAMHCRWWDDDDDDDYFVFNHNNGLIVMRLCAFVFCVLQPQQHFCFAFCRETRKTERKGTKKTILRFYVCFPPR